MFCKSCGKEISDSSAFCKYCGIDISNTTTAKSDEEISSKNENEFKGKLNKCPNCGEHLDSFKGVCLSCGYEIRGIGVVSSIKELTDKLIDIDSESFSNSKSFLDKLIENDDSVIERRIERKKSLIKTFPIPNTKEDLLEFMIHAMSQLNDDDLGDAWQIKYTQAMKKAQIMFPDDEIFMNMNVDFSEKKVNANINKKYKKINNMEGKSAYAKIGETIGDTIGEIVAGIILSVGLVLWLIFETIGG